MLLRTLTPTTWSNLTVTLADGDDGSSAFTGGNASNVTGATKSNIAIDFTNAAASQDPPSQPGTNPPTNPPTGDTTAPSLSTATVDGATLTLTYSESLDTDSVPGRNAFDVTVDGSARNLATTNPVGVSDQSVTLTLSSPVEHGQTVTLDYTVPASNPIRDEAGNRAFPFTGKDVTNDTPDVTSAEDEELPTHVALSQNYPNPFNPSTTIEYALPQAGSVRLSVIDLLGKEVAVLVDGVRQAANHKVQFDASGLPSGMYLYRLETGGRVLVHRMTLLK